MCILFKLDSSKEIRNYDPKVNLDRSACNLFYFNDFSNILHILSARVDADYLNMNIRDVSIRLKYGWSHNGYVDWNNWFSILDGKR